jgi:organic hydroperoxide reductase OsmC/OhrA
VYEARLHWEGSTGKGWERYARAHEAQAPPAEQALRLTTGEERGDPRLLNPEQLVVMAASSCQLLWFLHLASKARVDVIEYEDHPEAEMPEDWITEILLRPRIVVASDHGEQRVRELVELAHEHCYIANSLRSLVAIEPTIQLRAQTLDVDADRV